MQPDVVVVAKRDGRLDGLVMEPREALDQQLDALAIVIGVEMWVLQAAAYPHQQRGEAHDLLDDEALPGMDVARKAVVRLRRADVAAEVQGGLDESRAAAGLIPGLPRDQQTGGGLV